MYLINSIDLQRCTFLKSLEELMSAMSPLPSPLLYSRPSSIGRQEEQADTCVVLFAHSILNADLLLRHPWTKTVHPIPPPPRYPPWTKNRAKVSPLPLPAGVLRLSYVVDFVNSQSHAFRRKIRNRSLRVIYWRESTPFSGGLRRSFNQYSDGPLMDFFGVHSRRWSITEQSGSIHEAPHR